MKTYYLFNEPGPIATSKPVAKCQANSLEHAREKLTALYGVFPDVHTLISAEQWRDDNAVILEQMKLNRQENSLPLNQQIWNSKP